MTLALLAVLPLLQTTWTVDDDGPADFADLPAAVEAAAGGDTLLVMPGSYSPFTTSKALTVLGPGSGPKPRVAGGTRVLGAAEFHVAGMEFGWLDVRDVSGLVLVDDCKLTSIGGGGAVATNAALAFVNCAQVVASRLSIDLSSQCKTWFDGAPALESRSSHLHLAGSYLRGANGCNTYPSWGDGGAGLRVRGGTVTVGGCTLIGGAPGSAQGYIGCAGSTTCLGAPGYGVHAQDGAKVSLRGSGQWIQSHSGPVFAGAVLATGAGTVVTESGHALVTPATAQAGGVVHSLAQEAYVVLLGIDAPGSARRLRVFGPAGEWGVVLGSLGTSWSTSPDFSGAVLLDPSALFFAAPVVTSGGPDAETWLLPLPVTPGLAGLTATFQAAFPFLAAPPGASGTFMTNAAVLSLRF